MLEKYAIEIGYNSGGEIVVTIGNPAGDLTFGTPQHHHGPPIGTLAEENGDHVTVLVKALNPPVNNGDLVFEGIAMFLSPNSNLFPVVSVAEKDAQHGEVEKNRKRNTGQTVTSNTEKLG